MPLPPPPPAPTSTATSAASAAPPPPPGQVAAAAPPPPPPPTVAAPISPPNPPAVAAAPAAPAAPTVAPAPEVTPPPQTAAAAEPAKPQAPAPEPTSEPAPAAQLPLPAPTPEPQVPAVVDGAPKALATVGSASGGSLMAAQAEEEGLYGLKFGIGAFPFVALNQGRFRTSDKEDLGEAFWFKVTGGSRPKYLVVTALSDKDPKYEFVYSYDKVTDISGKPVQEIVQRWAAAGIAYEIKDYLEITVTLANDAIVLLSIPDSSNARFAACWAKIRQKGLTLKDTWILAGKGEQITPKNGKEFTPWKFSLQGE